MFNPSSLPTSRETLGLSSASRGLAGMERTAAIKGTNAAAAMGLGSKPGENPQPERNALMQEQSLKQNYATAVSGAQTAAAQEANKDTLLDVNKDVATKRFLQQRLSEIAMVRRDEGIGAMAQMNGPELAKMRNDIIIVSNARGVSPDLLQNSLNSIQYMA